MLLGLAEKNWASNLDNQIPCGILGYLRYRDDILVATVASFRDAALEFIEELVERASPVYQVSMEEERIDSIEFLDLSIFRQGQYLKWKPYRKPTSQKRPLSCSSAHSPGVHLSWPRGEVLRLARRSSSHIYFLRERTLFRQFLLDNHIIPMIYDSISDFDPWLFPHRQVEKCNGPFLVLPYHPLAYRHLSKALGEVQHAWSRILPESQYIRISWSNNFKNLSTHLRRIFCV